MTLEIDGLCAGYGDLQVLRAVTMRAAPGELVVVAGPNGAGKTTLLGCLSGTLTPTAGSIRLGDRDITRLGIRERVRTGIGTVPEGRGLFGSLTVRENLRVAAAAARLGAADRVIGIDAAVAAFPVLGERMDQRVATMSGGQQQMVAVGRALLCNPDVVLLDEPSVGLAPKVWQEVLDICRGLADEGRIVLLVEQRVRQALEPADRCVVLQQGRVVHDRAADAALADPDLAGTYFTGAST
jgi:branched-chain amino acid transport system ATP-binding protein